MASQRNYFGSVDLGPLEYQVRQPISTMQPEGVWPRVRSPAPCCSQQSGARCTTLRSVKEQLCPCARTLGSDLTGVTGGVANPRGSLFSGGVTISNLRQQITLHLVSWGSCYHIAVCPLCQRLQAALQTITEQTPSFESRMARLSPYTIRNPPGSVLKASP